MNIRLIKKVSYLCKMRLRDENKEKAVINATIKVVNEVGFASASIAKIAKEAGVSAATIYIYHANKDDLMVNVFYEVKRRLTQAYAQNLDAYEDTYSKLKMFWENIIRAGGEMYNEVFYVEQFANSPFHNNVNHKKIIDFVQPFINMVIKGQKEGVLKNISIESFIAFFIAPANYLGNRKLCATFNISSENIAETFELAWEAIKLKK